MPFAEVVGGSIHYRIDGDLGSSIEAAKACYAAAGAFLLG